MFVADEMRARQSQVSVRLFAASVDGNHRYFHPLVGRFIRCKYTPTRLAYAVEAAHKYGIAKGGWAAPAPSCNSCVLLGTVDRVP